MSEREPIRMEREPSSVREVEAASQKRESNISARIAELKAARIASREAMDAFEIKHPYGSTDYDKLWQEQCLPSIEQDKKLTAELVEALQNHYDALKKLTDVPVHTGENTTKYTAELIYPVRDGDFAMRTMRFSEYGDSLAAVLSSFRGNLVGDGLHNFGLATDKNTRIGEVDYTVKNDKDFSFTGKVWLSNGGHLVRDMFSL